MTHTIAATIISASARILWNNSMEWPCGTLKEVPTMLSGCGVSGLYYCAPTCSACTFGCFPTSTAPLLRIWFAILYTHDLKEALNNGTVWKEIPLTFASAHLALYDALRLVENGCGPKCSTFCWVIHFIVERFAFRQATFFFSCLYVLRDAMMYYTLPGISYHGPHQTISYDDILLL